MFNSNFAHNAINAIGILVGIVGGILAYSGCVLDVTGQTYDCTSSWIPPDWLPLILGALFVLKAVINITRDGIGGLIKTQPPVADSVTTVVQPVNVSKGETTQPTTKVEVIKNFGPKSKK